ncbi:hypothetical protein Zmor_025440 [Zophobas morio]|uniref:Uncharacterized protein n=1 Tax=Zophobas morio TaxID=2755281 RepID=A0AA38HRZ2_9CUCU|nr:hypothetical protein Zmor_025440 [Zophobas morio]
MNPDKCRQCHHCCHQCHHHDQHPVPTGYYWRDYTGEIPADAFPGGHDLSNKPIYIGQAYLSGVGLIPTNLYPGQAGLNLPCDWKVTYSDVGMKILCTPNPNSLSWENATSSDLHVTAAGKQLVIGGYQSRGARMLLNVGRVPHQGELLVGKVVGSEPGQAVMYYVGSNKENAINSYQVLVQKSDK